MIKTLVAFSAFIVYYMMKKFALTAVSVLCLMLSFATAQIKTTPIKVEEWVKNNFGGQGVVIGNIKHSGSPEAFAAFTSTPNILQVNQGLIISTGNALGVGSANSTYNYTKAFGDMKVPEKDADLSRIIKQNFYDISFIEFDFVPLANNIHFSYQFGSEEYPEYVGSAYNDIFAFFVSDESTHRNIALIPGKNIPVSVNTINFKTEANQYIDNNIFSQSVFRREVLQPAPVKRYRTLPGRVLFAIKRFFTYVPPEEGTSVVQIRSDPNLMRNISSDLYRNLQYDGITRRLEAQAYVEPYKKYHLKIIIADVSDNIYDSGVFIQDQSFAARRDELQPGFVDYPDLSKYIDAQKILEGKKLSEILPDTIAPENGVIYFDFDKSEVSNADMQKLKGISQMTQKLDSRYRLKLTGHTDSIGTLEYNMALSHRRNQAVIDSLHKINPSAVILNSSDRAFLNPVTDNKTDEGRMKNRRVEILFVKVNNE